MEEENEAYTVFQHLNKMRWRKGRAGSSWDHFDTKPTNSLQASLLSQAAFTGCRGGGRPLPNSHSQGGLTASFPFPNPKTRHNAPFLGTRKRKHKFDSNEQRLAPPNTPESQRRPPPQG